MICTSPSKTFNIAGLNTSNIIIPDPDIRSAFQSALRLYHVGSISALGSTAAQAAYTGGREWLDEVLVYLQQNMDYVINYVETHMPEIKVRKPEATYLLWLDFRALGMDQDELSAFLLAKAKLALNNGGAFGQGGGRIHAHERRLPESDRRRSDGTAERGDEGMAAIAIEKPCLIKGALENSVKTEFSFFICAMKISTVFVEI
ncbi:aminotransferase class I/II-fold pyridoxal phosphate-dependent enzyme [Paenibacillus sp. JTLBN-2024]